VTTELTRIAPSKSIGTISVLLRWPEVPKIMYLVPCGFGPQQLRNSAENSDSLEILPVTQSNGIIITMLLACCNDLECPKSPWHLLSLALNTSEMMQFMRQVTVKQ